MRDLLVLLLLLVALRSGAATYYVSSTGNDQASGLSPTEAFASLQHAADVALAGDSVQVLAGSYTGFAAMDHSGAPEAPIVFFATPGTVSIAEPCPYNELDGINVENVEWVVIDGFIVNGMPRAGIRTALSDHVTIRNNSCHGNYRWGILTGFAEHVLIEHNTCSGSEVEHGIYFSNSADDPVIRFNRCFDNNANGIHMNGDVSLGGDGVISNAQVYGNVIHGNGTAGGSGINCDGVVNSVIHNNLLYDNHASGISLYRIDAGGPSTGNRVYNNTIINAADGRWCLNITDACTGNQVLNNILINQHPFRGSIVIAADALDGFVSDHNLVIGRLSPDGDATILDLSEWQALGFDTHSQLADPQASLFVAPGIDHHAVSDNAQQVDAGTDAVLSVVAEDLDGLTRPQGAAVDIGCYERDASTGITSSNGQPGPLALREGRVHIGIAALDHTLAYFDHAGRLVALEGPITGADRSVPLRAGSGGVMVLRDAQGRVVDVLKLPFRPE